MIHVVYITLNLKLKGNELPIFTALHIHMEKSNPLSFTASGITENFRSGLADLHKGGGGAGIRV